MKHGFMLSAPFFLAHRDGQSRISKLCALEGSWSPKGQIRKACPARTNVIPFRVSPELSLLWCKLSQGLWMVWETRILCHRGAQPPPDGYRAVLSC